MTDNEIQGELIMLDKQIGRTAILTEAQSRIQMYSLLEIEFPDKYRPKLPTTGKNELNSNILMAKKLGSVDGGSVVGGSSRYSNAQSVVARLTSNPPPVVRSQKPAPFIKEIKPPAAPRGRTQTRPTSLLSQSPNT